MTKFRLRVKGSKAFKPSIGSSSANSKVTKHRTSAKSWRVRNISSMSVIDDQLKVAEDVDKALDKHLPFRQMSLGESAICQLNKEKQMEKHDKSTFSSDKSRLSKSEQSLWNMLPSDISSFSLDCKTMLPMFLPVIGAALNEPEYCYRALISIRSAINLDIENRFKIMDQYAKNFLPILFSIYINGVEDLLAEGKNMTKLDPVAVHQSILATIRIYMRIIPKSLLKQYISIALSKLLMESKNQTSGDEIILEQKILLADIITTMCISAEVTELQTIFNSIKPWFNSHERHQKKAYRLMAQIYQRVNEQELRPFFISNEPFLKDLIISGVENLGRSSLPWRIAIYINVLSSFDTFDNLVEFSDLIYNEIMDYLLVNSKPTRQQSARCLAEISEKLLYLWSLEENSCKSNPLDALFCKLFAIVKRCLKDNFNETDIKKSALIALNILTRKHLRNLSSATLVAQLIDCISEVLNSVEEASVRLLSIRLMRTACSKMPPLMLEQYKNIILLAVFSQPIKNSTVQTRKAISFLLDLLIDLFGFEEMLLFVKSNENFSLNWLKMLKNSDKKRRRRQRLKTKLNVISSSIRKKIRKAT